MSPSATALLVVPPTGLYIREDRCQIPIKGMIVPQARPPIDLAIIAGALKNLGLSCFIFDYPIIKGTINHFQRHFLNYKPSYLIISTTPFTINKDLELCRLAKRIDPSVITIAKGLPFLYQAEEIFQQFPELDYAVVGDYFEAISNLVNGKDPRKIEHLIYRECNKIIVNRSEFSYPNLKLPQPAYELLDIKSYSRPDTGRPMMTLVSSLGCPYDCIFCAAPLVWGKRIRHRVISDIIGELKCAVKHHNLKDFYFLSDTFTAERDFVIEICKGIMDEGIKINWVANSRVDTICEKRLEMMKKSGCWGVALGVESGVQRSLDVMKKGTTLKQAQIAVEMLKEFNLRSLLYFIIGFPWETEEEINQTIDFACSLGGDYAEFHFPVPYPGTELYSIMKENGLVKNNNISSFNPARAISGTIFVSASKLNKLRKKAILKFYLRPSYILRNLTKVDSISEKFNLCRYGLKKVLGGLIDL